MIQEFVADIAHFFRLAYLSGEEDDVEGLDIATTMLGLRDSN